MLRPNDSIPNKKDTVADVHRLVADVSLLPLLESKVEVKEYMEAYRAFKKVVPSIGEEKRLGREFEEVSGYSLYRATQAAKQKEEGWFSLEE